MTCCRCNKGGSCRNCSCAKAKSKCKNCLPCLLNRCLNIREPSADDSPGSMSLPSDSESASLINSYVIPESSNHQLDQSLNNQAFPINTHHDQFKPSAVPPLPEPSLSDPPPPFSLPNLSQSLPKPSPIADPSFVWGKVPSLIR